MQKLILIVVSILSIIVFSGCRQPDQKGVKINSDTLNAPISSGFTIEPTYPTLNGPVNLDSFLNTIRESYALSKTSDTAFNNEHSVVTPDTVNIIEKKLHFINDTLYYDDNSYYINSVFFKNEISFLSCRFLNKYADIWAFSNKKFDSTVDFINNYYFTNTLFSDCEFNNRITFFNERMSKELMFSACVFKKGIDFEKDDSYSDDIDELFGRSTSMIFLKDLKFYNSKLGGKINLRKSEMDQNLIFKKCSLPDTLDLSYTKISGTADLMETYLDGKKNTCAINLLYTDIDKIYLQYQNFHLYFPDKMEDSIRYKDLVSSTYESLLNNFKKRGYEDSYEKLDIEYKDWQNKNSFWIWVSGWWWKYGYEKWRVLIWTITVLLIFSLLNVFIYDKLFATYKIDQLNKTDYIYSKFSLIKALENYWLSIMYTGFIFFKLSIDFDKIKIKSWGVLLLIFFEYAVGLLCTGYLLNWVLSK